MIPTILFARLDFPVLVRMQPAVAGFQGGLYTAKTDDVVKLTSFHLQKMPRKVEKLISTF